MSEAHELRRKRLRVLLAGRGLDALLVSSLVNVRYLTGFIGSNAGLLIPAVGEAVLATDSRYAEAAAAQCPDVELLVERDTGPRLAALAERRGWSTVAYESHDLTVDGHRAVQDAARGLDLVRGERLVEALRAVKDEGEVAALRAACATADAAFADVLASIRPGVTERTLAADLESRMRRHGSEAPSFDTIVAAGENAAVPHHRPTDRPVAVGDFVKIDFGAVIDGYHSDMDPYGRRGRAGVVAARRLRAGGRRPAGGGRRGGRRGGHDGGRPGVPPGHRGRRHGATGSSTGSATAWGSRYTRRLRSAAARPVRSGWRWRSRSSRASTCRDAAACASRTPWWSARPAPNGSR